MPPAPEVAVQLLKYSGMTSRQRSDVLLLAGAVILTRFLFRSRYLYDIDSVNFALAIRRFDPRVYQPHPPGYFLYIGLGRLFNSLLRDANLALVVLSIAASCGTVILIYRMALSWFGWRSARFAGLLFLLSPLAWFHGTVALTYSVEAFFSALLGYLCWLIAGGRVSLVVPAAIALGVSAGVRPSSLLFLGPLFVFSLRKVSAKRRGAGVAALALALAAWFLPMIRASGGFHAYFEALLSLWRLVPSKDTVFNSSPATSIARACTIVFIYLLTFGAASLAPLAALRRRPGDSEKKLFTAVWMGPALCFFTLIFLKFVNSGYLLLLATPASIWLGRWASDWYETTAWRKDWKLAALGMGAAANVLIFLAAPVYCSYRSVRRFEAQLSGIRAALPQVASPKDTLLIGFDSHFLGYRHAGYYLPSYLTVQYPEVKLIEGVRIFALEDRDTRLLTGLPLSTYSKFVLFPLPGEAASYRQYLDQVKSRLGEHRLRTIDAGGYQFLTGPITDLPLLFPPAAPGQKPGVYVVLHSGAQPVNSRAHQSAPAAF